MHRTAGRINMIDRFGCKMQNAAHAKAANTSLGTHLTLQAGSRLALGPDLCKMRGHCDGIDINGYAKSKLH